MGGRRGRWAARFWSWLQQPGLVALGMFYGLTPPFEWFMEGEPCPPQRSPRSGHAPGLGHPERLVPHLPPSPAEQALWSELTSDGPGAPRSGHADRLP
ncbi:DUF6059 family protein [Streptomyces sp. NPDC001816]|uniref:DUF6059 family protein n=1 Tax=Streptomyces sp. NPDC001816 TaxID=3364612 RepID=UPI0036915957